MSPETPGPVLARLQRPRASPARHVAIIADPHLAVDHAGSWKVYHRTRDRLRTAVADANARSVDFTLVAGDLTKDGTESEFDAAEAILADLDGDWAAIPGNHDVPKEFDSHEGISVASFADRFAPAVPFAVEVGPLTLVGLNSASTPDGRLASTWGGTIATDQLDWLADTLARADRPIVVCHHNLAPLPENPGGKWSRFPLRNGDEVLAVLRAHDAPLAVTAHHHVPAVRHHDTAVEVLAPAVCSFPQASLLLEVDPDGTTVRLVPLADVRGLREAHRCAREGKPLGRGVLDAVERRLSPRSAGARGLPCRDA